MGGCTNKMRESGKLIGIGHSAGGHAIANAASMSTGMFDSLLLIDPVIPGEESYQSHAKALEGGATMDELFDTRFASKRKNHFESWQSMYERYASKLPYSRWNKSFLLDYCKYGLLPEPLE